jgi:hypothetical protein
MRLCLPALVLAAAVAAQERSSLAGTWELAGEPRDEARSYGKQVAVPAAFETALGTAFDGAAWYRIKLPLRPEQRGGRVRVEFAAVATKAQVFCNGKAVGEHLGPWTPFRVDVTDALQWTGNDLLEVRVDEKVGHNTQGFLPVVAPHFGGIWQDVTLCVDRGPVIDRLSVFVFGRADGSVTVRVPTLAAGDAEVTVDVAVLDGARPVATASAKIAAGSTAALSLKVPDARPWAPGSPNLYGVRLSLRSAAGAELDRLDRRVGCRDLKADGTAIRWNGAPLQVRGVLHWGYSPPFLAPPSDVAFWRRQLEDFRSLGFNTLKCCLWVPPPCVYDLCDEMGLLVWQEYPTWHPTMDAAHKDELVREYGEFFAADGSHACVAFRSLTCETGHGAELDVVKALFDACHAAVPDTLVVDDSSWIGWQRITDFWDEHPYGNNRWWPGRLAEFQQHIADKGKKPLLLGECIAADTWVERRAWTAVHGDKDLWWRPGCLTDQARFEAWLQKEFGEATLASLLPVSRQYAMTTRRYQIERLRMTMPEAGYVVSVARDFQKARMGLYDDFDQLKWSAADWSWQRDAMLCLDAADDRRGFVSKRQPPTRLSVRQVHGTTVSAPLPLPAPPQVAQPTRHHLAADAGELHGEWDVWLLPPFDDSRPDGVRVVDELDAATLDYLDQGGRVYLHVVDKKHSLRSEGKWYLTGAPFAPPHPVHRALPAELLVDLQPFDLDGGRVMAWTNLVDQVDPILAFWETHDIEQVRAHLFAFDCRVGKGRLLASAFDNQTDAGRYVEHALLQHLATGPAAQRALSAATLGSLRSLLSERKIDLPVWRFRTDPQDAGKAANWQNAATDVSTADWRDLKAGAHWENQGADLEHYDGVAWYRIDVDVPADWRALDARLVFDGIDDSATVWLNGEQVGSFGDPATKTTVWLVRSVAELGQKLQAGGKNTIVLRVVDFAGAGGLWKPAFLTTGPADAASTLLQ